MTSLPIRVAINAPCPPPFGGITRVIENHLNLWPKDSIEAHFLPMYVPNNPEPPQGALFENLLANSKIRCAGVPAHAALLSYAPLTRPKLYRDFLRYNSALSDYIKRYKIDVIYAHEIWPAGASAVLQGKSNGVGNVVVAYGEVHHTIETHRRQRRVEPYVLKGTDHVISTSQHCLDGALNRGATPDKSSVIYAGVDTDQFHPLLDGNLIRRKYKIPPEGTIISALGLSLKRKLDTLLDALEIADLGSNVYCLIGGMGDDHAYVEQRAQSIRSVDVRTLGFVPEEELPAFYAATDILVVSPKTQMECMGQSMKEAMACGTVVAGARIGGVPEAIEDGVNGLLFEPDDAQSLVQVLESLCKNRDLREQMGQAGRKIAANKFDAEVAANKTLSILVSAASQKSEL